MVGCDSDVAVVFAVLEDGVVASRYGDTGDVALDSRRQITAVDTVAQRECAVDLAGDAAEIYLSSTQSKTDCQ